MPIVSSNANWVKNACQWNEINECMNEWTNDCNEKNCNVILTIIAIRLEYQVQIRLKRFGKKKQNYN